MDVLGDPRQWAERTFGSVDLGDPRRTRRLVRSAAVLAKCPERSFPQVFDWNGLRAFYRLCDQATATREAIMQPHWEQTRQTMRQQSLVLLLHDTTELDYTSHPTLSGVGPIGNGQGRGFLQHNTLAVVPTPRQVLGLAYQQVQTRKARPAGDSTARRRKRARESDLWMAGIRAVGEAPEASLWVDVCDRGGDIYESMCVSRSLGHQFLFRAKQDRVVFLTPEHDREQALFAYARSRKSRGRDTVAIPGRGGRPGRAATVHLAGGPVWVPPPRGFPQRSTQPVLAAWVVRVWEPDPPEGSEPLEWILLGSVPTTSLKELKERRDWYACRWMAEVFHDIEKNGCREEDRRLETAERLETGLAILSLVAVRLFQMRCALDHQPEASASAVATADEITVVRRFIRHTAAKFTVRDFVRGVARLGGFLGRTGDGSPGVRTLWRGYQRLQDLILGSHLRDPPLDEDERCW